MWILSRRLLFRPILMFCTYLLTPWCRVRLEKLTGLQLVKKFPAFHGTRRFITALTSVRHLSLSWASTIQSINPHPTYWRSSLIISTHLRLGLPNGLLPSGFPSKTLYSPSHHPYAPHGQPIMICTTARSISCKKLLHLRTMSETGIQLFGDILLKLRLMKSIVCSKMRNLQRDSFEVDKRRTFLLLPDITTPGQFTKMTKISQPLKN